MKMLTIRLPDPLAQQLEEESLARRVSKSDIVRERLAQPGTTTISGSNLEHILKTAWSGKVPARPRRFRSSKKMRLEQIIRGKKLHR
jgi:Ribbon-helix-helix protein, copG family